MTPKILKSALVTAVVLIAPASARAGSYHVYSCRTPAGAAAPADGWTGTVAPGSAYDVYAVDTCSTGGALVAALGEKTTHAANVDRATWEFSAPEWAAVTGMTLWRAGYLHGKAGEKATYQSWLAAPTTTKVFSECIFTAECHLQGNTNVPLSSENQLTIGPANLGPNLYANVSCGTGAPGSECGVGFTDPNNYAAVLYLYAADILLEQTAGPTAGSVAGELATAPSVAGASDVSFAASDPGSGVYEAQFTVDGQLVQTSLLNENGGRCRDVGESADGLPAFLYVKPCLSSLSADVALDTTGLTDGAHHLVVTVTDAAGNVAPVLDRTIDVANPLPPVAGAPGLGPSSLAGAPGAPNGINASAPAALALAWKGSRGSHLTSEYGRSHTILGRLTGASGAPIGGAQLEVLARPSYLGAAAASMSPVHTAADGTFSMRLPGNVSSRSLTFLYRAHAGDAFPAASAALVLSVRAGIQLSVAPRVSGVGRRIYFSGRLLGGPYPPSGKLLVLEARSPGSQWIKFNVVRAGRAGRFHASYRFRFPGPATYRFRVLSEPEGDYPYATGASATATVYKR